MIHEDVIEELLIKRFRGALALKVFIDIGKYGAEVKPLFELIFYAKKLEEMLKYSKKGAVITQKLILSCSSRFPIYIKYY